ncbi:MAG: hypothetical protein AB1746_17105 [Candidatus Zixiibacteriota bacterium]
MNYSITKLILLLLVVCLIGCSDKSTDPVSGGGHDELKFFRLYANVKDSAGNPVEKAWVDVRCYVYVDSISTTKGTMTDEYGNAILNYAVLYHRDTVLAFAHKGSVYSDTIQFRVDTTGQWFFRSLRLNNQ